MMMSLTQVSFFGQTFDQIGGQKWQRRKKTRKGGKNLQDTNHVYIFTKQNLSTIPLIDISLTLATYL